VAEEEKGACLPGFDLGKKRRNPRHGNHTRGKGTNKQKTRPKRGGGATCVDRKKRSPFEGGRGRFVCFWGEKDGTPDHESHSGRGEKKGNFVVEFCEGKEAFRSSEKERSADAIDHKKEREKMMRGEKGEKAGNAVQYERE